MSGRRYDRTSRMDRARRRRARRRVMMWVKWAVVILSAAAFALALTDRAAGGFTWADTAVVFMISVLCWAWLEGTVRLLAYHLREYMRAVTRERVLERRSGRGAGEGKEFIKMKG